MAALTDYLENKLWDHINGKTSYTMPTPWYALFTVSPTDSTTGTEAAYTSYARVQASGATWNAASGGSQTNASAITFPACTGSTSTVVAFGAFDASTGGNLLYYGSCSLSVSSGITPEFAAGQVTCQNTD